MEPLTLGIQRFIADEFVARDAAARYHYTVKEMQHQIGSGLIDTIWQANGKALVELHFSQERNYEMRADELRLYTRVTPVHKETMQIAVPHFEYFPADWYCLYCNSLNDGLKNPRSCQQCGGPRRGL